MTDESLPIEYSITGFSHSATTSRKIWMLSASRRCKCVRPGGCRGVTRGATSGAGEIMDDGSPGIDLSTDKLRLSATMRRESQATIVQRTQRTWAEPIKGAAGRLYAERGFDALRCASSKTTCIATSIASAGRIFLVRSEESAGRSPENGLGRAIARMRR